MMSKAQFIMLSIVIMMLVGCSTAKQQNSSLPFENTKWILEELNGKSSNEWKYEKETPNITFEANSDKFKAYGGCNQMFGSYQNKDGEFKIDIVGSTKMYCSEVNIEDTFYSALTSAIKYEIENEKLIFYDYSGKAILLFKAE